MGSRWHGVVVDASDPARLGRWWAEVLGYRVLREDGTDVAVGPAGAADATHPVLLFTRAEPGQAGRSRLRLDLGADDRDDEIERLVNMGARHVDLGQSGSAGRCVLLADPEGNEFSVLRTAETGGKLIA